MMQELRPRNEWKIGRELEVGQELRVVIEEVFNGGLVVKCAAAGLRGALLNPYCVPVYMSPDSCLANPLSLVHDHPYPRLHDYVKKIRKTVLKQSLIHWNSAKPKNMVSSRRTCISGTTAGAASGNGACSIGGSIKQPVSVELGASNHPVCVTIASEGRRAKMLASEKIALRRELYKIPARPKVKKKEVRSKSQPCHLRSLGKKFHSCSGVSGNVSGTTMKISLTPCVPTNSARNDHKNGNPVSNSCPPTQKVKSIEQEMKCRKKLKFLRDDTTPMTSSTLSSPITITSSPSPPPSSPSLQETIWIASSPESTPDINSSGDTDTSAIIDIEGDTSSDTCNESKPLFIRNFSICIAPIKI